MVLKNLSFVSHWHWGDFCFHSADIISPRVLWERVSTCPLWCPFVCSVAATSRGRGRKGFPGVSSCPAVLQSVKWAAVQMQWGLGTTWLAIHYWKVDPGKRSQSPPGPAPWNDVWTGLKRLGNSSTALVPSSPFHSLFKNSFDTDLQSGLKIKFFCIIKLSIWLNILKFETSWDSKALCQCPEFLLKLKACWEGCWRMSVVRSLVTAGCSWASKHFFSNLMF